MDLSTISAELPKAWNLLFIPCLDHCHKAQTCLPECPHELFREENEMGLSPRS